MEDPGGREETPPNIELEFRKFDEKDYTSEFYSFHLVPSTLGIASHVKIRTLQ